MSSKRREYIVMTHRVAPGLLSMSAVRRAEVDKYKKSVYDLIEFETTSLWLVTNVRNAQQAMAACVEKGAGFNVSADCLWARSEKFQNSVSPEDRERYRLYEKYGDERLS